MVVEMAGERKWQLIDIAVSQDHNIGSKENEKFNKYKELVSVIRAKTEIVSFLIGALGRISKQLKTYIDVIVIPNITGIAQISTITSTARILRDVLSL